MNLEIKILYIYITTGGGRGCKTVPMHPLALRKKGGIKNNSLVEITLGL